MLDSKLCILHYNVSLAMGIMHHCDPSNVHLKQDQSSLNAPNDVQVTRLLKKNHIL